MERDLGEIAECMEAPFSISAMGDSKNNDI